MGRSRRVGVGDKMVDYRKWMTGHVEEVTWIWRVDELVGGQTTRI